MNPYWNLISAKHQDKLRFLAKQSGITADRALRDIISYLEKEIENSTLPYYFKELITSGHIEWMIDIMTM